jgi:hypothetical protein
MGIAPPSRRSPGWSRSATADRTLRPPFSRQCATRCASASPSALSRTSGSRASQSIPALQRSAIPVAPGHHSFDDGANDDAYALPWRPVRTTDRGLRVTHHKDVPCRMSYRLGGRAPSAGAASAWGFSTESHRLSTAQHWTLLRRAAALRLVAVGVAARGTARCLSTRRPTASERQPPGLWGMLVGGARLRDLSVWRQEQIGVVVVYHGAHV